MQIKSFVSYTKPTKIHIFPSFYVLVIKWLTKPKQTNIRIYVEKGTNQNTPKIRYTYAHKVVNHNDISMTSLRFF